VSAATVPYGRREPALGPSLALSALAPTNLIRVLFLGVRFQSSTPAVVEVELWQPPPPAPPAPVVELPKPPPPPPPVVKPEPEPVVKKPDIALPEKPKPKPEPKKPEPKTVEPKPKPKPKPEPKPKPDPAFEKMMREQAAREQQQLAAQEQERQMRELLARQQAAAQAAQQRALATWSDKIRTKVRGNIILRQDIPGNPEAIFLVTLLPTGEVLTVRKKKSSGHPGYDDAVERAIMKSSPLPLPDDRSIFRRELELIFQPKDR
jgi:colicin import membrane protein